MPLFRISINIHRPNKHCICILSFGIFAYWFHLIINYLPASSSIVRPGASTTRFDFPIIRTAAILLCFITSLINFYCQNEMCKFCEILHKQLQLMQHMQTGYSVTITNPRMHRSLGGKIQTNKNYKRCKIYDSTINRSY